MDGMISFVWVEISLDKFTTLGYNHNSSIINPDHARTEVIAMLLIPILSIDRCKCGDDYIDRVI